MILLSFFLLYNMFNSIIILYFLFCRSRVIKENVSILKLLQAGLHNILLSYRFPFYTFYIYTNVSFVSFNFSVCAKSFFLFCLVFLLEVVFFCFNLFFLFIRCFFCFHLFLKSCILIWHIHFSGLTLLYLYICTSEIWSTNIIKIAIYYSLTTRSWRIIFCYLFSFLYFCVLTYSFCELWYHR